MLSFIIKCIVDESFRSIRLRVFHEPAFANPFSWLLVVFPGRKRDPRGLGSCFGCQDLIIWLFFFFFQVIAFSDEEGVRFQSTFLGSAAIAGVLPVSTLHVHDKRFT